MTKKIWEKINPATAAIAKAPCAIMVKNTLNALIKMMALLGTLFLFNLDNFFDKEYYNPGPRDSDGSKYPAQVLQPGFNMLFGIKYRM